MPSARTVSRRSARSTFLTAKSLAAIPRLTPKPAFRDQPDSTGVAGAWPLADNSAVAAESWDQLSGYESHAEKGAPSVRRALTPRERQVLQLIADGFDRPDIAKVLFVSEETVKTHVSNLLWKLNAANRARAIAVGFRLRLIS